MNAEKIITGIHFRVAYSTLMICSVNNYLYVSISVKFQVDT